MQLKTTSFDYKDSRFIKQVIEYSLPENFKTFQKIMEGFKVSQVIASRDFSIIIVFPENYTIAEHITTFQKKSPEISRTFCVFLE